MTKNYINVNDTIYETNLTKKFLKRKKYVPVNPKEIKAFIPGVIKAIEIKKGQKVKEGDMLFILEAMKMQNRVYSPLDGKIKDVMISLEQQVAKNELLIEFE